MKIMIIALMKQEESIKKLEEDNKNYETITTNFGKSTISNNNHNIYLSNYTKLRHEQLYEVTSEYQYCLGIFRYMSKYVRKL